MSGIAISEFVNDRNRVRGYRVWVFEGWEWTYSVVVDVEGYWMTCCEVETKGWSLRKWTKPWFEDKFDVDERKNFLH